MSAVSGVRCTRERRPWRSVRSHPALTLRASAWRAACVLWPSEPSAPMSVSCQTPDSLGRTYSPSIVSSTDRAAGAPTDRRRSCSFTSRTIAGRAAANRLI